MSSLISEDEDYVIVREYLHNNSDEHPEWAFDENMNFRFPDEFYNRYHYALYEVEFNLVVNKKTGEYIIASVKDGDQILVPQS